MAEAWTPSPLGLAGSSGGEDGGQPGSGRSGRPGAARFPCGGAVPGLRSVGRGGAVRAREGREAGGGDDAQVGLAGGKEAARPRPGEDARLIPWAARFNGQGMWCI